MAQQDSRKTQLAQAVSELQAALKSAGLWSTQAPPAGALQSTQPFCIDTLSFPAWLQFVGLPRLQQLSQSPQPMPVFPESNMAAMAEVYLGQVGRSQDTVPVLMAIKHMDQLLTAKA